MLAGWVEGSFHGGGAKRSVWGEEEWAQRDGGLLWQVLATFRKNWDRASGKFLKLKAQKINIDNRIRLQT